MPLNNLITRLDRIRASRPAPQSLQFAEPDTASALMQATGELRLKDAEIARLQSVLSAERSINAGLLDRITRMEQRRSGRDVYGQFARLS